MKETTIADGIVIEERRGAFRGQLVRDGKVLLRSRPQGTFKAALEIAFEYAAAEDAARANEGEELGARAQVFVEAPGVERQLRGTYRTRRTAEVAATIGRCAGYTTVVEEVR